MSYRLLGIESLGGLTESQLEALEELKVVPGERDMKLPRLKFVRELIAKEEFNRVDWASCHCKGDGTTYRVNGQHTSAVLREMLADNPDWAIGVEFPAGVPVVFTRYECDTVEDLGDVFDQFDNHRSTRKPEDKLGIFMAQHTDMIGIDKQLCSKVLSGIAWGVNNVPSIQAVCEGHSPGDAYSRGILLTLDVVRDFVDLMHQHAGSPFREWQQKSGIIARLFDLFIVDREMAELAIEQTLYEAGEKAEGFTKKIRQSCAKTGKDQGHYYRITDKYVTMQLKEIASVGRDAIKEMIREVMDEEEVEAVA